MSRAVISPELGTAFSTTLLDMLLGHYAGKTALNQPDYLGVTALHMACACGNLVGVQRLLERGANINAMDNGSMTPHESVGDQLFILSERSLSQEETPSRLAAINGRIVDADIEYYIYLRLSHFLLSKGALPGQECLKAGTGKPTPGPVCALNPAANLDHEQRHLT